MLQSLLPVGLFIALGVCWRYVKPNGVTAESMQKSINALILWVLLPLVVFLTMYDLPLNVAALQILLYVLGTTLIALGVAWFWLFKTKLPGKTKGAYLIAAVFGNALFLGLPLNKFVFPDWTTRVAIEYMLVANVLLLFTVGAIFAKDIAEPGKPKIKKSATAVFQEYPIWVKEPVIWAALIGLVFNLADAGMPDWANQIVAMIYGLLIPLLLVSVGLSLTWLKSWNNKLAGLVPVVVIQLILVPLLMWAMASLFGSAGFNTTKALLFDSMLPATLFGFVMCERYKLDTTAYAMAFTATSALSLITVPLLYNVIL